MGKEISLIAFLDEVVSRNTQHYRKDFELDAAEGEVPPAVGGAAGTGIR